MLPVAPRAVDVLCVSFAGKGSALGKLSFISRLIVFCFSFFIFHFLLFDFAGFLGVSFKY
jgi:hypothetical protein